MQTEKGQSIEDQSMQIIDNEIGTHQYNEQEWPIVRRIIHATADFDFARENKIIFRKDGLIFFETLASYGHLYFDSSNYAKQFVSNCVKYSRR